MTRKRAASNSSEVSNASSNEAMEKETVQVDFQFTDPVDMDYHALRQLLLTQFGVPPTSDQSDQEKPVTENVYPNVGNMVDLILSQSQSIGTCIKCDDSADPVGVLSVLNLEQHQTAPFMTGLKAYLAYHLEHKAIQGEKQELLSLLSQPRVGWIVSQRIMNVPPQVMPPMLSMLLRELAWAEMDKEPFIFDHFLWMVTLIRPLKEDKSTDIDRRQDEQGWEFVQPEESFLMSLASQSFTFRVAHRAGVPEARQAFRETPFEEARRVFVLPAKLLRNMWDKCVAEMGMPEGAPMPDDLDG